MRSERGAELEAFDETRAGVKGVVDAGITKLPNIFIHPQSSTDQEYPAAAAIIDLAEAQGDDPVLRRSVVAKACEAAENYGFDNSPPCPEPKKTICTPRHVDNSFITVLLQDHIGGLHERQWFDVPPVTGALVVNIGDFLQLLTNDKFKSVEHRVVPSLVGPRVSVASFFNGTRLLPSSRMYGPFKELLSDTNPPKYRETTLRDFILAALKRGVNGTSGLVYLKF